MVSGGYVKRNIWGEASYKGHPVTDWYPPNIKPVREGLYEVGSDELSVLVTWNGKEWIRGDGTALPLQEVCWRGLKLEYE